MLGIGRVHVDDIATHAEGATRQIIVISIVLDINERMDKVVALERHLLVDIRCQARIVLGRANAVDTRNRCNDDYVTSRKQRGGRLMAQHLDLLVNRGVLLDIRITLRHIRFGLIVVVVRHKIDHGVVGKEFLELARELGGKCFIGSHDQRRLPQSLNGLGHREGLARAGHAQQNLIAVSVPHALYKRLNGLRLRTCRLIRRYDLKWHLRALNAKTFELSANTLYFKFRHGYS